MLSILSLLVVVVVVVIVVVVVVVVVIGQMSLGKTLAGGHLLKLH
jgi:hypothetical protein